MDLGLSLVQPNNGGLGLTQQKKIFLKFCDSAAFCFTLLCLISVCISCRKNTKFGIKIPGFRQLKKKLKKEKNVFVHTAKCLKAKKSYCVFHTPKKQCFSMHFGFNNQFIKVRRTLAKISKTTKILLCLTFSIQGTTLQVIRILNIKFCFFFGR